MPTLDIQSTLDLTRRYAKSLHWFQEQQFSSDEYTQRLARAEVWLFVNPEYEVIWEDEQYGDHSYLDQECFEGYTVETCEIALLLKFDPDSEVCHETDYAHGDYETVASLGCIDDADDNYHRIVAAELALEVMPS